MSSESWEISEYVRGNDEQLVIAHWVDWWIVLTCTWIDNGRLRRGCG